MNKIQTISNEKARLDSHAPGTVAAWNDHFIVQTKPAAAILWGSAHCAMSEANASRVALTQPKDVLVRIVKPSRKIVVPA